MVKLAVYFLIYFVELEICFRIAKTSGAKMCVCVGLGTIINGGF